METAAGSLRGRPHYYIHSMYHVLALPALGICQVVEVHPTTHIIEVSTVMCHDIVHIPHTLTGTVQSSVGGLTGTVQSSVGGLTGTVHVLCGGTDWYSLVLYGGTDWYSPVLCGGTDWYSPCTLWGD